VRFWVAAGVLRRYRVLWMQKAGTDPYGVHGDRWFSAGRPTNLVRDDGVESRDEPPPGSVPGPLVEVVEPTSDGPYDLKRAGDFEKPDPTIWGVDEFLPSGE
jgi:hypothetical protein